MTPSITRRFARYHGIAIGDRSSRSSVRFIAARLRIPKEPIDDARARVVQSLTRIEDAEMLIECGEGSWSNAYGQGYRNAHTEAGLGLLVKEGIDPDKWREVKDEEA
jgi:hypothetical protein